MNAPQAFWSGWRDVIVIQARSDNARLQSEGVALDEFDGAAIKLASGGSLARRWHAAARAAEDFDFVTVTR
jgi:hypothetical protein